MSRLFFILGLLATLTRGPRGLQSAWDARIYADVKWAQA
jgi:hypothetical protein